MISLLPPCFRPTCIVKVRKWRSACHPARSRRRSGGSFRPRPRLTLYTINSAKYSYQGSDYSDTVPTSKRYGLDQEARGRKHGTSQGPGSGRLSGSVCTEPGNSSAFMSQESGFYSCTTVQRPLSRIPFQGSRGSENINVWPQPACTRTN